VVDWIIRSQQNGLDKVSKTAVMYMVTLWVNLQSPKNKTLNWNNGGR